MYNLLIINLNLMSLFALTLSSVGIGYFILKNKHSPIYHYLSLGTIMVSVILFIYFIFNIITHFRYFEFKYDLDSIIVISHCFPFFYIFSALAKEIYLTRSQKDYKEYAEKGNIAYKKVENMGWNDIIISSSLREELTTVVNLLKNSKGATETFGIDIPKGILLSGPPGNGKTSIARILANQAGLNFFTITNDLLISKYVGESEKYLTRVFEEAERQKPSIVFIDEIDSIARSRSESSERWAENLLNHLLQLLDGIYSLEGVFVIGATNRPELIDAAIKRPGRLSKEVVIPSPDEETRAKLFSLYLKKLPLEGKINTELLASRTAGLSGAEISGLCNSAGLNAFKRHQKNNDPEKSPTVNAHDIIKALNDFSQDE